MSLHWQMGSASWGGWSTGLANEESVGGDAGRSVWGGPSVIEGGQMKPLCIGMDLP